MKEVKIMEILTRKQSHTAEGSQRKRQDEPIIFKCSYLDRENGKTFQRAEWYKNYNKKQKVCLQKP